MLREWDGVAGGRVFEWDRDGVAAVRGLDAVREWVAGGRVTLCEGGREGERLCMLREGERLRVWREGVAEEEKAGVPSLDDAGDGAAVASEVDDVSMGVPVASDVGVVVGVGDSVDEGTTASAATSTADRARS